MPDSTPPSAGWYASPDGDGRLRWWNGVGWADTYRDAPETPPTPPYAAPAAGAAYAPPAPPYTIAPPPYAATSAPGYAGAPGYPGGSQNVWPPAPPTGFGGAISSVFRQYVGFGGVASRSEYWFFVLFSFLVQLVLAIPDGIISAQADATLQPFTLIWSLGTFLPSLAVGVRRLRDAGYHWAWLFIGLIPLLGAIILIVFLASRPAAVRPPR